MGVLSLQRSILSKLVNYCGFILRIHAKRNAGGLYYAQLGSPPTGWASSVDITLLTFKSSANIKENLINFLFFIALCAKTALHKNGIDPVLPRGVTFF